MGYYLHLREQLQSQRSRGGPLSTEPSVIAISGCPCDQAYSTSLYYVDYPPAQKFNSYATQELDLPRGPVAFLRTASERPKLAWVSKALNRAGALRAIGRKKWNGV